MAENNSKNKLLVGFSRVDATPDEPTPLGGYANDAHRLSRAVRDPLFVTCYAITDEADQTALLINIDVSGVPALVSERAQERIKNVFGIPEEQVKIAGTHTHSAPELRSVDNPIIKKYDDKLDDIIIDAVGLALSDRTPSSLFIGEVETDRLNFVRHYKATPPEGEEFYYGDNMNSHLVTPEISAKYSTHATEADHTVHILKFERENAKDLLILNWRAHATLTGGFNVYDISADFPGEIRRHMEEFTDCYTTYFQGASGNIQTKTRIPDERITEECYTFGKLFAETVVKGLDNLRPADVKPMKFKSIVLPLKINHTFDDMAEKGYEAWKIFKETNNRPLADKKAREYGFHSCYHALSAYSLSKVKNDTYVDLSAFSLGNIGFITAPGELFDGVSVYAEENAPYEKVITLGYCNGMRGYFPTKAAYEYGCYEADMTEFAPGSAEQIAEAFVEMLKELK